MSLIQHYLQTATELCRNYDATAPFQIFLKHFFSQHKKYGSRDRKMISGLCYGFYRLGKAAMDIEASERMKMGWFLISNQSNKLLQEINEDWNQKADLPSDKKLALLNQPFTINEIAPFENLLSEGIDENLYATHFLTQPAVFIRTRPGKELKVIEKIKSLGWDFVLESESAIRLPASSNIDAHFRINEELIIQDLNSQRAGDVIAETFKKENFAPHAVWDCCAASGGKSIMLKDIYPGVHLTVSDIRSSILHNLQKRFKEAGIHKYQSFAADLIHPDKNLSNKLPGKLNFILADVPCTGSGTWSRTPEQLYFFNEAIIDEYAEKQFAIASNAISRLNNGGYFVYITCSVFNMENEINIERLMQHYSLQLIESKMLDGTKEKADSMYVAILRKMD